MYMVILLHKIMKLLIGTPLPGQMNLKNRINAFPKLAGQRNWEVVRIFVDHPIPPASHQLAGQTQIFDRMEQEIGRIPSGHVRARRSSLLLEKGKFDDNNRIICNAPRSLSTTFQIDAGFQIRTQGWPYQDTPESVSQPTIHAID